MRWKLVSSSHIRAGTAQEKEAVEAEEAEEDNKEAEEEEEDADDAPPRLRWSSIGMAVAGRREGELGFEPLWFGSTSMVSHIWDRSPLHKRK